MSKRAFRLDIRGFGNEVMKADFTQQLIADTANEIADKANAMGNGEYVASSATGRKRALGMVVANDFKARKDDYDNNTLLKSAYPLQVVEK